MFNELVDSCCLTGFTTEHGEHVSSNSSNNINSSFLININPVCPVLFSSPGVLGVVIGVCSNLFQLIPSDLLWCCFYDHLLVVEHLIVDLINLLPTKVITTTAINDGDLNMT
jgi:hypothetical protein